MIDARVLLLTVAVACSGLQWAGGADYVRPEPAGTETSLPSTAPQRQQVRPARTAPAAGEQAPPERDFSSLLLDRPAIPLTAPDNPRPRRVKPDLPECGSAVVGRLCRIRLRPDTGWYLLTFQDDERGGQTQPRWVLPTEWLEALEATLSAAPDTVFRVSGETTVYKGRVFLFLRGATAESPTAPPAEPAPARTGPDEQPAEPAGEGENDSQASLLRRLMKDRPGKPISLPAEPGPLRPAESVAPPEGLPPPGDDRGGMRIDRLVTILPDPNGEWWEARFESDNTLRERPVRLLPCKLLQRAEQQAQRTAWRTTRFRVSGEVTRYKGRDYLLLRKALPERAMGQF